MSLLVVAALTVLAQVDHSQLVGHAPPAPAPEPGQSEREHVPPDPPATRLHMHEMSYAAMAEMMGMDDRARFRKVMLDRLEWIESQSTLEWEAAAWYGGDVDKVWIESEGEREREGGEAHTGMRSELHWDHITSAWWSTRAGLRLDSGAGPSRTWAAFGFAGLAPGFIEVEALAYLGESGRTALRLTTETDLRITRRLILQPELELEAHGEGDPERAIGSGLSQMELALRLRYEIRREVAPYVGVRWLKQFGDTADLARAAGADPDDIALVAGLRIWF